MQEQAHTEGQTTILVPYASLNSDDVKELQLGRQLLITGSPAHDLSIVVLSWSRNWDKREIWAPTPREGY